MSSLKKPIKELDDSGLDLNLVLNRSIAKAIPLCAENDKMEKETQENYLWVKDGKKYTRKKIIDSEN